MLSFFVGSFLTFVVIGRDKQVVSETLAAAAPLTCLIVSDIVSWPGISCILYIIIIASAVPVIALLSTLGPALSPITNLEE